MSYSIPLNKKPIINYISRRINSDNLKSVEILDLGTGRGDFAKLIRKKISVPSKITGVEIYEKNKHKQWNYYDELVIDDIRTYVEKNKKEFDIILLVDVLEHFDEPDGRKVIDALIKFARRAAIIGTPTTKWVHGPYKGNPYEVHKFFWKDEELLRMGFRRLFSVWVGPLIKQWPPFAQYGVYVFEKWVP